jgi:hypothetical protein
MSFNPYLTTAENHALIMARHNQESAHSESNECYSHDIVSKPNGQSYGKVGHVPCDHTAFFYYNDGSVKTYSRKGESCHWETIVSSTECRPS